MLNRALTLHIVAMIFACCSAMGGVAYGQADDYACGPIKNAYGPYDYRSEKDKLEIVESRHFNGNVASLISGMTGNLGGDIDYTLRASPNHHRALMAMFQLGEREKTNKPRGANYSVECYFNRALRFRENDGVVRMIYATFLARKNRNTEALTQLKMAAEQSDDNANLHYNIALIYFDLKDYTSSLKHAHVAYRMGFPLPGLRDKLKRAGKWQEPPPLPPEDSAAPSSNANAMPRQDSAERSAADNGGNAAPPTGTQK